MSAKESQRKSGVREIRMNEDAGSQALIFTLAFNLLLLLLFVLSLHE